MNLGENLIDIGLQIRKFCAYVYTAKERVFERFSTAQINVHNANITQLSVQVIFDNWF